MEENRQALRQEILVWINQLNQNQLLRIDIEEARNLGNAFIDKYFEAPEKYLKTQKELITEFHKRIFNVYTTVFLAIIGVAFSVTYVEIALKFWPILVDSLQLLVGSLVFGAVFVFGVPSLTYVLTRYVVYPILRDFTIGITNKGDIERYIIGRILETRRRAQ